MGKTTTANSTGVRTEYTYHDEQIKKDKNCWTSSVHGRDRLSVVISVDKPARERKLNRLRRCSEMYTVLAFCEHGNELAGFGNGEEFYKHRKYCQIQNKE